MDTINIHIRQLSGSHYEKVKDIFQKAFDKNKYPEEDLETSWIERSHPDSFGFFVNERIIGFVIASYHSRNGSNMYIDYLALLPEFRGSGIGSILLRRLIERRYAVRGSLHLYPERDELLGWYKRHGFNETNKNYYVFHSYGTRKQNVLHKSLGL